jgi:hypothetical protein
MKRMIFSGMFLISLSVKCQVIMNLQLPPVGLVQKDQLWNMLITNTGNSSVTVHIELMMTDVATAQQVLGAVSKTFFLSPGSVQYNSGSLNPIQYNILSSSYNIDPGPGGFLPVGNFSLCYTVLLHNVDAVERITEDCETVYIEPLSPPQLVYPWDETAVESKLPTFSWLPPSPVSFFTNLRYDFDIVEIFPGQSAVDAIQQNIPVLHQPDLISTSLLYPASAQGLDSSKTYAWRITAKSNGTVVSTSETWSFAVKQYQKITGLSSSGLPFARLSKDDEPGYTTQVNSLKFEYFNELRDSTWNITVNDLSIPGTAAVEIRWDTIPMQKGQNLVTLKLTDLSAFADKHLYYLELRNSRNEIWKLKFEFRKNDE